MTTEQTSDYESVLAACYETDPELLEKYHVLAPTDLESAVENTANVFRGSGDMFKMKKVFCDSEFAGYYGIERIEGNVALTGFFVMPQYRNKEFLSKFVSLIKEESDGPVYCGVYSHNQRAIKFLEKSGFGAYTQVDNAIFYKLNQ